MDDDQPESTRESRPRGLGHRKASKTTRSDPRILARRRLTAGQLAEEYDSTVVPAVVRGGGGGGTNFSGATADSEQRESSKTSAGILSQLIPSSLRSSSKETAKASKEASSKEPSTTPKLPPEFEANTGLPNSVINKPNNTNVIVDSTRQFKLSFMCRAFSSENKDGHHANEDRFYCEEHLTKKSSRPSNSNQDSSASNSNSKERLESSKERLSSTSKESTTATTVTIGQGLQAGEVDLFTTGVLDGHDGSLAADIASDKLPSLVINNCLRGVTVAGSGSTGNSKRQLLPHDSHVHACQYIENLMKKQNSSAGCCLNSCLVWGRYLWSSNLGDCRSVFIVLDHWSNGSASGSGSSSVRPGKFTWLSRDQRASKAYEVVRMRSKGYDKDLRGGRIEGCLEPSRTLGDLDLKEALPDDIISITPETRCCDIVGLALQAELNNNTNPNGGTTSGVSYGALREGVSQGLIIQGTDGLWDGLSGEEIYSILTEKRFSEELRELQRYMDISGRDGTFDPEKAEYIERLESVLEALTMASVMKPECSDDTTCVLTLVTLHERAKMESGRVGGRKGSKGRK